MRFGLLVPRGLHGRSGCREKLRSAHQRASKAERLPGAIVDEVVRFVRAAGFGSVPVAVGGSVALAHGSLRLQWLHHGTS